MSKRPGTNISQAFEMFVIINIYSIQRCHTKIYHTRNVDAVDAKRVFPIITNVVLENNNYSYTYS